MISGGLMTAVAMIGLAGNVWQRRISGIAKNVTHLGVNWHIASDIACSIGAVSGGILIVVFRLPSIDTYLSFGIAIFLVWGAIRLVTYGEPHAS